MSDTDKKSRVPSDLAPETVGFRLSEHYRRILATRARKAGMSAHEFARECVVESLHEKEHIPEMRDAIVALHNELRDLRARFAVGVEALLVTGSEIDAAEARAWVEKNLKSS